jgi:hypothetical protein
MDIQAIAGHRHRSAEELTELIWAIGAADHGVNLERGFKAVPDLDRRYLRATRQ